MAVKMGGPDPAANFKLKDVISKCKANNMPNDTINNAIKKASGANNSENYEEITYEGYGPAGVAVVINAATDNKNRTAADVRHIFDKFGGNLGTTGCVSYLFSRKGVIIVLKEDNNISEDDLMLMCIEAGAENFENNDEYYEITTTPEDFSKVTEKLEKNNIKMEQAEIRLVPSTYITLDDDKARKMQLLIDHLEDLDDVLEIYHNWDE